jgi:hypothetical protein
MDPPNGVMVRPDHELAMTEDSGVLVTSGL